MQTVLITGGAGFIGQNLVHAWRAARPADRLVVVDAMTYAANIRSLEPLITSRSIQFVKGDICDAALMSRLFEEHKFTRVAHLAAESHVDRSIADPEAFLQTNVLGTFTMLQAALDVWRATATLDSARFLHVSTDEVYGSLGADDPAFTENTRYAPNSPYSASKAGSDHLVRAYFHTYGLPVVTTNCSNNYGPFQFPEKLIPLVILHAITGKPIPVYGDGQNVRDWLYVSDHCEAIRTVLAKGRTGETYNIGGRNEIKNLDVVHTICSTLDLLQPNDPVVPHRNLIKFVTDRPGHDRRYAMDASKIESELGWKPRETFASGICKTVQWYLDNEAWVQSVTSGSYRQWMAKQYSL